MVRSARRRARVVRPIVLRPDLARLDPRLANASAKHPTELGQRLRAAPDEHDDEHHDQDHEEVAHGPDGTPRVVMLVFGPRSPTYDFGPAHPLTPRRFGPGIELLESLGAMPGPAPVPASEEELEWIHEPSYIAAVKAFSRNPWAPSRAGIGPGDTPAFTGMHEASAAVAGGSLRAMEAILRGEALHAFHPGGGLHHAMPARASGFCVYDDPALAIARARRDALRVLYIDLDVHHGDGVQAIHWSDPGVMTLSLQGSGRYLYPGTGAIDELGEGVAAGTAVDARV